MAIFTKKVVIFFTLFTGLVMMISLLKPFARPASDYMAAIIDKHNRLASVHSPAIILQGGSSLAFGVDSSALQSALHVPVVNLGLHGGLGLSFMLNELKASIKPGDIVLLSPEYLLSISGDYSLINNTSGFFPPARQFYSKKYPAEFLLFLENNQKILKSIFAVDKVSLDSMYTRTNFNAYGDFVGHLNAISPGTLESRGVIAYSYWEGIDEINQFYDYAQTQQVRVFFLFPNYPVSEYARNKTVIDHLAADLRQNLKVDIINTPQDFLYPDNYFYDTIYHLNKLGRDARTHQLIQLLQNNPVVQPAILSAQAAQP